MFSKAVVADANRVQVPSWPEPLAEEAFYGLAGETVRTIEPHTEADPVALLIQYLTAFGNIVGRGPHFVVEQTRHGLNLFLTLVGATSKREKVRHGGISEHSPPPLTRAGTSTVFRRASAQVRA